jgi:beta-lactamase regulating signal transducer with metallopeptidase domain
MHAAAMNLPLEISRFIAQAFIAGLWQGLILVFAVALVLRLVPRVNATARFAVWGFAFALAVAMPLLHLPGASIRGVHDASVTVHLGAGWGVAIAAVWAILMLVRGAQLLLHTIHLRRIWRQAQPVPVEGAIQALLQRSGRRTIDLCVSIDVDSPSVIGFLSPRLLIPEWLFARLAPLELQQIVLHECEHLRRGDDWINLLQKIGLALFPLNPALLWLDRRLSLERELACDAGVVSSTAARFDYAHCLTRLAEHRLHRRSIALTLSAWSRQSELAQRVHQLLRPARNMSPLRARFSVALICLGLCVGAIQMAKAPRLFSFTDAAVSTPIAESGSVASSPASTPVLPVVYRQATQPRTFLTSAVLPLSKPHRAPHKPVHPAPSRRSVQSIRPARQPRIVLTTFEMQNLRPGLNPGTVDRRPIQFSPAYAAVPFGDGWLVIQL